MPWRRFASMEAAGGIALLLMAAIALVIANSPAGAAYQSALKQPLGMLTLQGWVNDGLMAVFFLFVGLELKREWWTGDLRRPQQALLPIVAAVGGMVVPCLVFTTLAQDDPVALRGWAIPTATDIAFALTVLALLGPRVPASLRIFLTALAIIDDLGTILIIGLFYNDELHATALLAALVVMVAIHALHRRRVTAPWPYLLLFIPLWLAMYGSGLHATLAGVALAFLLPLSTGLRLERRLAPWVAFGIMPLFALANAGLNLSGLTPASLLAPVPLGIILGLLIGKPLGIIGGTWLGLHISRQAAPPAMQARQLLGLGLLGGTGFTMSLFIAELAYTDPALVDLARGGIFLGSLLSAIAGYWVLRLGRAA